MLLLLGAGFALGKFQTQGRDRGTVDLFSKIVQRSVAPIARPLAFGSDGLGEFFYGVFRARKLEAENERMRAQLGAVSLYSDHVDLLNAELEQLRRLSGLGPLPGKERVVAEVIGFAQYENRITLNVGAERGIKPNMPVINGDGLVGIVQTVTAGQCQAVLLTSFGLKLGGIDISRKPPPVGLLKARDSSTLTLTLFDPKAPAHSGDTIVTSGFSERIPRGLIVGRIVSVEDDIEFGTRSATVYPSVNLGTLREVQVLR